jgi:hypothetical protein
MIATFRNLSVTDRLCLTAGPPPLAPIRVGHRRRRFLPLDHPQSGGHWFEMAFVLAAAAVSCWSATGAGFESGLFIRPFHLAVQPRFKWQANILTREPLVTKLVL